MKYHTELIYSPKMAETFVARKTLRLVLIIAVQLCNYINSDAIIKKTYVPFCRFRDSLYKV